MSRYAHVASFIFISHLFNLLFHQQFTEDAATAKHEAGRVARFPSEHYQSKEYEDAASGPLVLHTSA